MWRWVRIPNRLRLAGQTQLRRTREGASVLVFNRDFAAEELRGRVHEWRPSLGLCLVLGKCPRLSHNLHQLALIFMLEVLGC